MFKLKTITIIAFAICMISCSSNSDATVEIKNWEQETGPLEGLYQDVDVVFIVENKGGSNISEARFLFTAETEEGNTYEETYKIKDLKKGEQRPELVHIYVENEKCVDVIVSKVE